MTTQFPDEIEFRAATYAITAIDGDALFEPRDHGLHLQMLSTACWRGHVCTYRVDADTLLLARLEVGLSPDEHPTVPHLFGRPPVDAPEDPYHSDAVHYAPDVPVDFTGRLLLGDDFVDDVYLNMGFLPAWLYHDVHELTFARGRLDDSVDRSAAAAELRESLGANGTRPREGETTGEWVDRTFSRTFDYSRPSAPRPTVPPV